MTVYVCCCYFLLLFGVIHVKVELQATKRDKKIWIRGPYKRAPATLQEKKNLSVFSVLTKHEANFEGEYDCIESQ